MGLPPAASVLATLPSAFAAACRLSRSDGELFERCRAVLVRRFQTEAIWLTVTSATAAVPRVGPADGFERSVEVASLVSGETAIVVRADPLVGEDLRAVAMPLAVGLSVVLELRSVLLERQGAPGGAGFPPPAAPPGGAPLPPVAPV